MMFNVSFEFTDNLVSYLLVRFNIKKFHRRTENDFLAGILCLVFGAMGTWVSLFSGSDGFTGGLFFLSTDQNVTLGRWMFGLGALICFSLSAYAFRRAAQSSK